MLRESRSGWTLFALALDELEKIMAKSPRRSSKEIRKPKQAPPPKQNASKPSLKEAAPLPNQK